VGWDRIESQTVKEGKIELVTQIATRSGTSRKCSRGLKKR
jgi:hypothetical protein